MAASGYTPISLYYSTTASAAPTAGNLVSGELAINITDGKLYYKDNAGAVQTLAGKGGTGVVAGSNTQIQYNNNGVFGASANLTFNGNVFTVSSATPFFDIYATGQAANEKWWRIGSGSSNFAITSINDAGTNVDTPYSIIKSGYLTTNHIWSLSGSEAMRLTSTGLGIGTSSPGVRLDVAAATAIVRATSTTGTNVAYYQASNTGGGLYIGRDNSGGSGFYTGSPAYGSIFLSTGAYPMAFATDSVERMRLDSSGNLGLGVTPSAWNSGFKAFQVGQRGSMWSSTAGGSTHYSNNALYDSGGFKYLQTGVASSYEQGGGAHFWYTAPSGTAGAALTLTQAMTLDSSGRLGINVTNPNAPIDVLSGSSANAVTIRARSANDYSFIVFRQTDGTEDLGGIANQRTAANTGNLLFYTAGGSAAQERARIDSSGNFLIGATSTGYSAAGRTVGVVQGSTDALLNIRGSSKDFYLQRTNTDAYIQSSSGNLYVTATSAGVYLASAGTSWTANSDERIKDIIEPISNATEKVCSLRSVIGKYKNDAEGTRRAFLIAQDVQAVLPEAVNVQNDDIGTLGLQYTDMIPLLVAAIKELKAEFDAYKASHP